MNNQTDVSIRFSNSITGEKKLEKYAQTLSTIKSVMAGIDTGVGKELEKSASNTKDIANDISTMSNITKLAFNYSTVREFSRMVSRTVSEMTRLITKSTEYLENINLYQVAFDGNYESADKFIEKMTEMYGLDESWLTRTVGIFKQLANAMNVSTETGEKLSTLLTQMSLDISSLYNVDMERASSVLQSAMAGQTKPIRGLTGGDITQATLQTTLDTLGIEKAVSELSFAEKRLLIVISLTQQLEQSIGDMGRTIESPANQMRVLNSQWERLSRTVGNVFMPILAEVLPYINAIMMVLTEIVSLVASLFGYSEGDFDYFAGTSDSVLELEDSLNGATDSAKKLKQGLRGFDKLNVINTPTKSEAGAGGLDADILDAFNSAFDDYQNKLENVQMKATRIRDAILDWLGFSDGTYKNLKLIAAVLGTIVGLKLIKGIAGLVTGTSKLGKLLGTGGMYKTLKSLFGLIKQNGIVATLLTPITLLKEKVGLLTSGFSALASTLGMSTGALALVAAGVVAIGASLIYAYKENDKFKSKVDKMVNAVSKLFGKLYDTVTGLMQGLWNFISPIWEMISILIEGVVKFCYESVVVNFSNIVDVITGVSDFLYYIIEGDFSAAFDSLINMVKNLFTNWSNYFKNIGNIFADLGNKLYEKVKELVPKMLNKMGEILTWISELPSKFFYWAGVAVGALFRTIAETDWLQLGKSVLDGIVNGIKSIGTALWDFGTNIFTKISEAFSNINWWSLGKSILNGIMGGLWDFGSGLWNWATSFAQGIWDGLTGQSSSNYSSRGGGGGSWGSASGGGTRGGRFANGGMPPVGQIFIANEKGPELIGQIGGKSFVANQNQMMDLLDKKIGNAQSKNNPQVFNIYLDKDHKLGTYTLEQLQEMSKTNGKPVFG